MYLGNGSFTVAHNTVIDGHTAGSGDSDVYISSSAIGELTCNVYDLIDNDGSVTGYDNYDTSGTANDP